MAVEIGAFRHETAHAYHLGVMGRAETAFEEIFDEFGAEWFRKEVSVYAGANYKEAFAECFSLFTHPEYVSGMLNSEIELYFDHILNGAARFGS